jgi:predicted ArsR family transcriptional regulator
MTRLNHSQQEIVELLRRRGPMTVEDLSRALGITSVAVRQHLGVLEAEGLLDSRPERRRPRAGRGRPRRIFHLTDAADELFPKNYGGLAQMILEHLERSGGSEQIEEIFSARRRRMETELFQRVDGLDLESRVAAVAEMQDQAGYMTDWEKAEDGSFLFREHNCVICKIARQFPQACKNELLLIETLTGAEVVREEHMARGDSSCSYRIRARMLH